GGGRGGGPAVPDSDAARWRLAAQPVPPADVSPRCGVYRPPLRRLRVAGGSDGARERRVRRPPPPAARRGVRSRPAGNRVLRRAAAVRRAAPPTRAVAACVRRQHRVRPRPDELPPLPPAGPETVRAWDPPGT